MYEPIAIIGFGLRTPGASSAGEFWAGLTAGRESLTRFTAAELAAAGIDAAPGYVPVRGILTHVTDFDVGLFGMTPFEAQITDPQHRVFLECAYEALENAGYLGETPYRIGVYAGVGNDSYLARHVAPRPDVVERAGQLSLQIAHDKDYLSTRVAYRLGLTGPALSVQTACSTSLVAVHLAARTLGLGEADVMLAGGVSIELPQVAGYTYQDHDILSPDGHCRAFDAAARGTVPGNGAAVVVLKRLTDAQRDGDTVYAVIRGSAVNNDGARKAGYTAPSVQGQADVIATALDHARLDPAAVSYIETHGTATEIGDAIEVAALREVFRDAAGTRVLGALKPNIGHLDTAAGVAGLIKAALALRHRALPPTINFRTPNPELKLDDGRFVINTDHRQWTGESLVCGVSSFGIGGTNAHVVLGEAPAHVRRSVLLAAVVPVSAHTPEATAETVSRLTEALVNPAAPHLADVATTWQRGRPALAHRAAAITSSLTGFGTPVRRLRAPSPVFLFTGTSDRFAGAAAGLAERFDVFGEALAECDAAFRPAIGVSLIEVIRAGSGAQSLPVAQSAIFALQHATARLLTSFGVQPVAVLGHSLGEYAAACHAGALSLDGAARLVTARAELAAGLPGRMIAVAATLDEVRPLLRGELHVSAINGPRSLTVAGPEPALAELGHRLEQARVRSRRVQVGAPYHSPLMDPIAERFRAVVADVVHRPLSVPLISTVTGETIPAGAALDGDYWMRHLRSTVLFQRAGEVLLGGVRGLVPLEIGPGVTLSHLLSGLPGRSGVPPIAVLPAGAGDFDPVHALLRAVADVWCAGVAVRWDSPGLDPHGGRVPLPTYPFERTRQWIDPADRPAASALSPASQAVPPPASAPAPQSVPVAVSSGDAEVNDALLGIWRDLLGVDEIGPGETFFSLGGQSIMVVRMIAEIKRRWGVTVPMADVLRDSSVLGLTEAVQRLRRVAEPT